MNFMICLWFLSLAAETTSTSAFLVGHKDKSFFSFMRFNKHGVGMIHQPDIYETFSVETSDDIELHFVALVCTFLSVVKTIRKYTQFNRASNICPNTWCSNSIVRVLA